jgi:hypothetical protein
MISFKNIFALVLSISLVSASATPTVEARVLAKRGSVLTAQYATETEVFVFSSCIQWTPTTHSDHIDERVIHIPS